MHVKFIIQRLILVTMKRWNSSNIWKQP